MILTNTATPWRPWSQPPPPNLTHHNKLPVKGYLIYKQKDDGRRLWQYRILFLVDMVLRVLYPLQIDFETLKVCWEDQRDKIARNS